MKGREGFEQGFLAGAAMGMALLVVAILAVIHQADRTSAAAYAAGKGACNVSTQK